MSVVDDVLALGETLERSYVVQVAGRLKFRVGSIVFVAFSRDKTVMGFAFPTEERLALVESDPHKFVLPPAADLRFNWVVARTAMLDVDEMTELVTDAWVMVVPKGLTRQGCRRGLVRRTVADDQGPTAVGK